MNAFSAIKILTQPAGSGLFQAPVEPQHLVRLLDLQNAISGLGSAHSPVTTQDTNSITFQLDGQLIRANLRRKTIGFTADEGVIALGPSGVYVQLGTGANQAARGADVAGLITALGGKSDVGHTHSRAAIDGLVEALGGKSAVGHTHSIADIGFLAESLNSKLSVSGTIGQNQVEGLDTAFAGKANTSHGHAISDISTLSDVLAGKADTSHSHPDATPSSPGFMTGTMVTKLNGLSANEQWKASVATKSALPLNTDSVGTVRMARDTSRLYKCIATVGLLDDQWEVFALGSAKYNVTIGNGVLTSFTINHNLDSEDVVVAIRKMVAPKVMLMAAITIINSNSLTVDFAEAPPVSGVRVAVKD